MQCFLTAGKFAFSKATHVDRIFFSVGEYICTVPYRVKAYEKKALTLPLHINILYANISSEEV